ncbi:MAG: hypothetical protein AAGF46_03230 [Pseudomonadota bacterium]
MTILAMTVFGLTNQAAAEGTLGLKASTLGGGIEASWRFASKWGLRASLNQFDYSFDDDIDDITYDGDLELSSATLLGDYRPTAGGFRLTGGLVFNGNEINGVADPAATYEIGDVIYTQAEVGELSASASFNDLAPYVGIGYDADLGKKILLTFDVGVLFQGSADVEIRSVDGTASMDPALLAELSAEAADAESDLSDYEVFPVIGIGLSWRFE